MQLWDYSVLGFGHNPYSARVDVTKFAAQGKAN